MNKKCIKQLASIGIEAIEQNGTVYVTIGDVQLELAQFEIEFRAKLFDEENQEA